VYYHRARTHLALHKDAPDVRPIERPEVGRVIPIPEVGGLHHRYVRRGRPDLASASTAAPVPISPPRPALSFRQTVLRSTPELHLFPLGKPAGPLAQEGRLPDVGLAEHSLLPFLSLSQEHRR